MNTEKLVQEELRRISKEIKTTLNNDPDSDREYLLFKAKSKYDLTRDEENKLRDLTSPY